ADISVRQLDAEHRMSGAFVYVKELRIDPIPAPNQDGALWQFTPIFANSGGTQARCVRYFPVATGGAPEMFTDTSGAGFGPADPEEHFRMQGGKTLSIFLGPEAERGIQ